MSFRLNMFVSLLGKHFVKRDGGSKPYAKLTPRHTHQPTKRTTQKVQGDQNDAISAVTEANLDFEMALCDYVELVTIVIVISVWAKYFLQTMVTSSGLLHRAKNEQNSTNGNSQASEMYWQ